MKIYAKLYSSMSKKKQFNTNVKLSGKLMAYIADNPHLLKKYKNGEFVVFVEGNNELNKKNLELVENVKDEEKNKSVIMATLTKNKQNPWKFQFAN